MTQVSSFPIERGPKMCNVDIQWLVAMPRLPGLPDVRVASVSDVGHEDEESHHHQ